MKEWFKARNVWGAAICALEDAEAGRLAKALWGYTMTGEPPTLAGAEKAVFAMIMLQLAEDERRDEVISNVRAAAGAKGGKQTQAKQAIAKQNQANQSNCSNKNKNKEQETETEQETIVAADPLALSETDIRASIERDQRIEDAARDVGLQVTTKAMLKARDLADQYGLEELLAAIGASVDVPKWAYVEGILRNGGVSNGHGKAVGNNNASPYAFLHG